MNDEMKAIFAKRNFVVLDTETTGLRRPAEIIDIAILDSIGNVLLNTLIKPRVAITPFITGLTGIDNDMVSEYPYWTAIKQYVMMYIDHKDVITYNATFDRHMMHCSDEMWGLTQTDYKLTSNWYCAMTAYAPHHGKWNPEYDSWKWAKLSEACDEQGIALDGAHRALADATATYQLLEKMCL